MKRKLAYPKMPNTAGCMLKQCWVFEKYDGTNMHWVHDGTMWTSFGCRRDTFPFTPDGVRAFGKAHPGLEDAAHRFDPERALAAHLRGSVEHTVFTEYVGPHSFAGSHAPNERKIHVLIDLSVRDQLLDPDAFLRLFETFTGMSVAKLLWSGKYSGQLVTDVREGRFPVSEGVVVKGVVDGRVYMAKIKTNAYLKRLQRKFDRWEDYWE